MSGYSKTKASVEKLLDLLRCDSCHRTLHEPYTNGVCMHALCFNCCTNSVAASGSIPKKHTGIGKICPLCFVPIRPCDVNPHPSLHNLVLVARRLAKLLGSPASSLDSDAAVISKAPETMQSNLDFLKSGDYYRFESPTPSFLQEAPSKSSDTGESVVNAIVASPIECPSGMTLQPVVVLSKNMADVQTESSKKAMPPPSVPCKKYSHRRRGTSRSSIGKTKTLRAVQAPLASPEPSVLGDTPSTSPCTRESWTPSVECSSGSETHRSTTKRRKQGLSSGGEVGMRLNPKGESTLHRAAIKNDVEQLKRILLTGVSPNVRDHAGWTPLHEAALRGHVEAAECLLTEGKASVDIPGGPDLETALHEAVFNRQVAVVRLLLNHHANPNFPNGKGVSPLQVSAERVAETQNEVLKTANKIPKGRRHKQHNSLEAMKDFQAIKDLLESAVAKMERNTITVLDTSESAAALFIERRRIRPILVGTGLERIQLNQLARVASLIHARISTEMTPEVTHLITGATMALINKEKDKKFKKKEKKKGKENEDPVGAEGEAKAGGSFTCPRTRKFLYAVLQGCWVLSFEWIETCDAMRIRVEEEAFEVTGCSVAPNSYASKRSRKAREAGSAGLFHGYRFCLLGNFSYPLPERHELCDLLNRGDATVFSRDVNSPSRLAYIAVDNPVIASSWMVQKGEEDDERVQECDLPSSTTDEENQSRIDDPNIHSHQLIALYDPHTSSSSSDNKDKELEEDKLIRRNSVLAAASAATIVGKPQMLVRAALRMMQPRLSLPAPLSAVTSTSATGSATCRCTPIRLVPVTWMMDCIAKYEILPIPNPPK